MYISSILCSLLLLFPIISNEKTQKFENLCASDFYILLNELNNEILIDARDYKAYEDICLENSVHLENKDQLINYLDTLDKETPILIYCDVGTRSKQACKFVCELHFVNVYNLKGGLYKWQKSDYPVVKTMNK